MARKNPHKIEYNGWHITNMAGDACATRGSGKGRERYKLYVPITSEPSILRAALIQYVSKNGNNKVLDSLPVGELLDRYQKAKQEEGRSSAIKSMPGNISSLKPWFGKLKPTDITTELCQEYTRQKSLDDVAVSTVYTALGLLSTALNWAYKERLVSQRIYIWRPSQPAGRERIATTDEVARLMQACADQPHREHTFVAIWLACATGARKGAILDLRWKDVDLESGFIDFKMASIDKKNSLSDPIHKGKQKARSQVEISADLGRVLTMAKSRAVSEYVIEYQGKGVSSIKNSWGNILAETGIHDLRFHDLRHTFATWLIDAGASVDVVSKILSHGSSKITEEVYVNRKFARPQAHKDAVNLISDRFPTLAGTQSVDRQ